MQIDIKINETSAKVFRGLIYPRNDGKVLYSIPKIMSNGKSNHNKMRVKEFEYPYCDRSIRLTVIKVIRQRAIK